MHIALKLSQKHETNNVAMTIVMTIVIRHKVIVINNLPFSCPPETVVGEAARRWEDDYLLLMRA